jgi:cytochrome c biogenesis factor
VLAGAFQRWGGGLFSEILFVVVILSWIAFVVADGRERERKRVLHLLTLMGTLLAAFSLLTIDFFAWIGPRVQ